MSSSPWSHWTICHDNALWHDQQAPKLVLNHIAHHAAAHMIRLSYVCYMQDPMLLFRMLSLLQVRIHSGCVLPPWKHQPARSNRCMQHSVTSVWSLSKHLQCIWHRCTCKGITMSNGQSCSLTSIASHCLTSFERPKLDNCSNCQVIITILCLNAWSPR